MRDWRETLDWYRSHQTAQDLGFHPDGMCLKICRTARGLPAVYPSAVVSQNATPQAHRVHKVADLRRGMVGYFDDPNDSNQFGHIATMIGRVKGADRDSLHDTLWETNSVISGQVVVVRGDYFAQHWGDRFVFGATWLNGSVLDVPAVKSDQPELGEARLENFRETANEWDVKILDRLAEKRADVRRQVNLIEEAVRRLPSDERETRVKEFKERFRERRILDMTLLNEAVRDGRVGGVKAQRDKLRQIIKKINRL